MFGYVTVDKPELKVREFYRYKGYYCGLCRSLNEEYGLRGRMTLTYDMTFLVLLLTSLYECKTEEERQELRDRMLETIYYEMLATRNEVSVFRA